jgi:hypothetical protein
MNDKYVDFGQAERVVDRSGKVVMTDARIGVMTGAPPTAATLLAQLEKSKEETREARLLAIEFFHRMYDDNGSGVNLDRKYDDVMGWPWLVSGEVM